ncbi:MAG TPA: hypothetical protein VFP72_08270 [Kineosporiaceae bacterium]|nr:hypothetical protein [Kineosporiaceae bacterium]
MTYLDPPAEYRGTSVQVCGLWPYSAGSSVPNVGVPLGRHLSTGATVSCDPIYWFLHGLINTPSMFVLGRPGLGKSTLVRRMVTVLAGFGVTPLILSDLKPDYVDLVEALDGQVIRLGRGIGSINPLDPGPLIDEIRHLPTELRATAENELRGRRQECLIGLCNLVLGRDLNATESTLITVALRLLDQQLEIPLITDLHQLLRSRHAELRSVALDRGNDDLYDATIKDLESALIALGPDGRFGPLFSMHTSTQMRMDRPVVFDVSAVDAADGAMRAAVQLVCWVYGSSAVTSAKYLSDARQGGERIYFLIMDELWQMLRASNYLVHRIDEVTRLNRQRGLAQALITHTMKDLRLSSEALTATAMGFVERSSLLILGGLSRSEFGDLGAVHEFSAAEQRLIGSWSIDADVTIGDPPGRGKFLIKTGSAPGIPITVQLTATERAVNDTNKAWHGAAERARHQLGGARGARRAL